MKRIVIPVVAVLLTVTACGSSTKSASPTSTSSGSSQQPDTKPIKLFQLAEIQSASTSFPFMQSSAEAAVKEINANGGVDGRMLELTTCNEAGDPNTAVKCAQSAEQDSSVVSMVGGLSLFGAQVNPILSAGKLPNIAPDAITPSDANSAMSFLIDGGLPGYYLAMPAVAKKYLQASKIAGFLSSLAAAATEANFFEQGAKVAGVRVVKQIEVPADAVDYTQYVSEANDAGATAIVSGMTQQNNLALWKALASSHSSLRTVMSAGAVSASLIQQAGPSSVQGDFTVDGIPLAAPSNPTGAAYIASMAKYEPSEKVISGLGLRAWLAVQLFAKVARTIHGPITRSSMLSALNKVHGMNFFYLNSLSFNAPGPLASYPRIVAPVVFPSKIVNSNFTPLPSFDPFAS